MAEKVRRAVIAAAGMGTRFLPQTKAMPKEMLPIIDKPVIQIVVEKAVAAGIEDIIIVTGPTKRAIEDHFDRSIEFEEDLKSKGKSDVARKLQEIAELANFTYVRQKGEAKGNAVPVINAMHILRGEPFMYFFADDFYTGDVSYVQQLQESYMQTGKSVVCLREIESDDTSRYGVVSVAEDRGNGLYRINGYHEKPGPEKAPSRLACVCGYLLTPDFLEYLTMERISPRGEVEMAEALHLYAQAGEIYGKVIQGDYHDTGSPELYLETIVDMALRDEKYADNFRAYLADRLTH